jgi:hypothetical protein
VKAALRKAAGLAGLVAAVACTFTSYCMLAECPLAWRAAAFWTLTITSCILFWGAGMALFHDGRASSPAKKERGR